MQRIQNRFGTAGLVVAIVALVTAMSGGAYAAAHASKAKFLTKPQVLALIKANLKAGPAGAAGTNGTNGTNGVGTKGDPGDNGANGKTVLSGTATPTAGVGTLGDFYMDTDDSKMYGPKAAVGANGGWGSGTSLKGADGSPWTAGGTLPGTGTLTGSYAIPTDDDNVVDSDPSMVDDAPPVFVPVSFSLPVDPAPTFVFVPNAADGSAGVNAAAGCPGVVAGIPQADSGTFCVYGTGWAVFPGFTGDTATVTTVNPADPGNSVAGVSTAGTVLKLTCPGPTTFGGCVGKGVWAVTGS